MGRLPPWRQRRRRRRPHRNATRRNRVAGLSGADDVCFTGLGGSDVAEAAGGSDLVAGVLVYGNHGLANGADVFGVDCGEGMLAGERGPDKGKGFRVDKKGE